MSGWGPELVKRRPDITMEMVEKYLTRMYRTHPDFVFTVTRDFVHNCQTPVLILPDDVPAHPYAVAMETAMLAPNTEVSFTRGKSRRSGFRWRCARYVPSSGRIGLLLLRRWCPYDKGGRRQFCRAPEVIARQQLHLLSQSVFNDLVPREFAHYKFIETAQRRE